MKIAPGRRHLVRGMGLAAALLALGAACGSDAAPQTRDADAAPPAGGGAASAPPASMEAPLAGEGPAGDGEYLESTATQVVVHGVDLTGVGYDRGDPAAPIVIVELSDFGCPYCAKHALETLPALESEYVQKGKVFYKYVPFVMGMFPNSERAVRAAECAGRQGRFWQMHDSVYARQADWKRGSRPDAVLSRVGRSVVPDAGAWDACYASGQTDARTKAANDRAARLGVRATPTMFVNGQIVEGALPMDVFRQGLDAMLQGKGGDR